MEIAMRVTECVECVRFRRAIKVAQAGDSAERYAYSLHLLDDHSKAALSFHIAMERM